MNSHFAATPLRASILHAALSGSRLGATLHRLGIVDSTQSFAVRLAQKGAPDGTVVLADGQTGGRGQRGQLWSSPPETGVYLSIVVDHRTTPALLAAASGLALVDAAQSLGVPAGIKWPNDLIVRRGKAGGVLAEALSSTRAVIGIGVNMIPPLEWVDDGAPRVFPPSGLWSPTTGFGREELVLAILAAMEHRLALADGDPATLGSDFERHDALRGHQVTLETNAGPRSGKLMRSHPLDGVTLADNHGVETTYRAEWTRVVSVADSARGS